MYISPLRRFHILHRRGIAASLVVAAVLLGTTWFWKTKVFSDRENFTLYFKSNVHGLSVGAPVIMNGQDIGQVSEISLFSMKKDGGQTNFYPAVSVILSTKKLRKLGVIRDGETFAQTLPKLTENGLRGDLKMPSMLASGLSVFLYFEPSRPTFSLNPRDAENPEIPTDYRSSSDYVDRANAFLGTRSLYEIAAKVRLLKKSVAELRKISESQDARATNARMLARLEQLNAVVVPARISAELSRANAEIEAFCACVEKANGVPAARTEELRSATKNLVSALENIRDETALIQALLAPENQENGKRLLENLRKQNAPLIRSLRNLFF